MTVTGPVRLEVLVEEPSAELALRSLLPRIVPECPFKIYIFNGKHDLLRRLPQRLRAYSSYWSEANLRVVVLLDRDGDDCVRLKAELERIAVASSLPSHAVMFRIVIEELEAWFLGDVPALCHAYPRLPASLGQQDGYRDPDAVRGTWEALERVLRKHGYHRKGLAKYVAAGEVAPHMDVDNNRSRSFQVFRDGLRRLVKEGGRGAQA
ncbi:DUF4276 family protein [Actinophytocola oryzae]|uniref:Uncharacterized protein DUF4276 n=1 Tax=Actinophytocola oryzae TaxID=502181 RepID=A0A4R7VIG2_9PSEU|nr:DUF4276 family protein [Actinophytocola oryzae]TDV48985.1 uncharacterized protein DUF4276 [Actinophytocola oryzae]